MKALAINQFGSPDGLAIVDVPKPKMSAREVMIKIEYTSINPVDWKITEGYLQEMLPHQFPLVPGWDAAGEIIAMGDEVKGPWKLGEKVMAYTRLPKVQHGTYAEYICVPFEYIAPIPQNISTKEAAAIPLVALTAYQGLVDVVKIKKGDHVLVTAGAGGVGSFAIQFAKYFGAKVYSTASKRNHSYLTSLGADHTIDYHDADYIDQLKELAPSGFDIVFDAAGQQALQDTWPLLKKNGRLVSIVDTPNAAKNSRPDVSASFHFVEPSGAQLNEISKLVESGTVNLPSTSFRSIQDAVQALNENKERHVQGKVVLKIDFANG